MILLLKIFSFLGIIIHYLFHILILIVAKSPLFAKKNTMFNFHYLKDKCI